MEFPADVGGITPDWLTGCLQGGGVINRARVASIDVRPVGFKGMTGQISQLLITYDQEERGAPSSVVAKFSAPDPNERAMVHSLGFYEREVRFYQELAAKSPIRTPRCCFGAVDLDNGASLLLLEDLSAMRNLTWDRMSVDEAELVVRELAELHAAWWEDSQLRLTPWLQLKGLVSMDQAAPAFRENWESFLAKLSIPVTEEILEVGRLTDRYLPAVYTSVFSRPPLTLTHNDVQGENLFMADDEVPSVVMIDWQLTTPGWGALDLSSLLVCQLQPEQRRSNEIRLLETYHSALTDRGVEGYSLAQCQQDYRTALLVPASRLATAVGWHPGLTATPGAFWNAVFGRIAEGFSDLRVGELLREQFG
jgi:thiamine kinase-like enzyme